MKRITSESLVNTFSGPIQTREKFIDRPGSRFLIVCWALDALVAGYITAATLMGRIPLPF